jgi:hypothetical protein
MSTNKYTPGVSIQPFNSDPVDQQSPLFTHVVSDLHKDTLRLMTGLQCPGHTTTPSLSQK